MAATIIPKKSTVSGKIPDAVSLSSGEIAINLTDGKLYAKHTDGSIVDLTGALELHTHSISQVDGLQTELNSKLEDAPTNGEQYIRQSGTWTQVDIPEGYTSSDFNSDFALKDTDDLSEGTSNLYHTTARAISAIKGDASWNASNWDTAYGWGDHSTAGYALDSSISAVGKSGNYNDLTNKPDLSALEEVMVYSSQSAFPATGESGKVYIAEDTGYMYRWNGTGYTQLTDQTAIWGQVSGTLSDQTDLQSALNGKANTTTQVIAGTGLSGGGNLSSNRTLSVNYGTTAGTAAQGNDSRLSDSREWTASVVSQAEAEAGTATTARKWSALRVRQSFDAAWTAAKAALLSTLNIWTQPQVIRQGVSNSALGLLMPTAHNVCIEFATSADSEDPVATFLGVRANGTLATGPNASLSYDIHTSNTLPVRSESQVRTYSGNGVTLAEDERAALELGPPVPSANTRILPGRNINITVSSNRTLSALQNNFGTGALASMTIRSDSTTTRTITLSGTGIINGADYDASYDVTDTTLLYLEGRHIEHGFVITFLTTYSITP